MAKEPESRLAQIRKAKGLSQQQLAEAIDAHWVTLSKLERGKIKLTYEWARRMASVLDVDVFDIFSPEASYKIISIDAVIRERGEIEFLPPGQAFRMDKGFYEDKKANWIIIETDDFYPILRRLDFVRMTQIEPHEVDRCRGRLCVVKSAHEPTDLRVGILGKPFHDGGEELFRLNGSLIENMEFFSVIGCITMALFAPGKLGEVRLKPEKS